MSERVMHCWADEVDADGAMVRVCLLPADHDGPCAFTPVVTTRLVVFPEEMGAWQREEDALVVVDPPLDQVKRARGDRPLPGLEVSR